MIEPFKINTKIYSLKSIQAAIANFGKIANIKYVQSDKKNVVQILIGEVFVDVTLENVAYEFKNYLVSLSACREV